MGKLDDVLHFLISGEETYAKFNHVTDHVTNAGTKNVVSRKHVKHLKSGREHQLRNRNQEKHSPHPNGKRPGGPVS